jgi:hypothetical protein
MSGPTARGREPGQIVFVLERHWKKGILGWGIVPLFPSKSPSFGVFGFRAAPFPFTGHLPEKRPPDQEPPSRAPRREQAYGLAVSRRYRASIRRTMLPCRGEESTSP